MYNQQLAMEIHKQNVEKGWWDAPRPFEVFVCLFHSEGSEAMEGDRKSLPDDHLKQYPMSHVEIADLAIRVYDYLGHIEHSTLLSEEDTPRLDNASFCFVLADIHMCLSMAWGCHKQDDEVGKAFNLEMALVGCYLLAKSMGFELEEMIKEKRAYNQVRKDHLRENRQGKIGQKKY